MDDDDSNIDDDDNIDDNIKEIDDNIDHNGDDENIDDTDDSDDDDLSTYLPGCVDEIVELTLFKCCNPELTLGN